MNRDIVDRVNKALEHNPKIVSTRDNLDTHPGYTVKEFEDLGLTKRDLKWLEKQGLALNARRPTEKGHIAVWVLLVPNVVDAEK